jgi:hypothetical protein
MHAITDETINEWYRQEAESYRQYFARKGTVVPSNESEIKRVRGVLNREYVKEVENIWSNERKRFENYQKFRFAEEYDRLRGHWDTLSLLYRSKKDWQGYAHRPGFEDTPNDLLEEMKGSHHRGMSLKALEHAARKVELINMDCKDPNILEKRKNGIHASGFADTTLYKYLEEGRKVRDFVNSRRQLENPPSEPPELTE